MVAGILTDEQVKYFHDHFSEFLAEGVDDSVFQETLKAGLQLIATLRHYKAEIERLNATCEKCVEVVDAFERAKQENARLREHISEYQKFVRWCAGTDGSNTCRYCETVTMKAMTLEALATEGEPHERK